MRRFLRAGWRLTAVAGVIAGHWLVLEVGRLVLGRGSKRRARWRAAIFRRWTATLLAVLGVRVEVQGTPPQAPFILVSNHLSYVDILVLGSRLDGVFIAKREVASWPIFGPICRRLDTLFIDRRSRRDVTRVLDAARTAFERGDGVILFPEGTSTAGTGVLPFRPSLLDLPVRLGQPVHYASLSYSAPPLKGRPSTDQASKGRSSKEQASNEQASNEQASNGQRSSAAQAVCWWGDMTFPGHFWRLLGLPRVDARVTFGARAIRAEDRKILAAELHRAVSADFRPMVGSGS